MTKKHKASGKLWYNRISNDSLPDTLSRVFFLIDSWYTNGAVYNVCLERGFHMIGAMKTNRIICPDGNRISIKNYATTLSDDCFRSATVKGHTYKVYRYEGSLNKIKRAVVLIFYSERGFRQPQSLRTYLCSDISLSDEDIPAIWCVNQFVCYDVMLDPIKVFGQWRYNNDGMDSVNSQGITIRNSLIHSL